MEQVIFLSFSTCFHQKNQHPKTSPASTGEQQQHIFKKYFFLASSTSEQQKEEDGKKTTKNLSISCKTGFSYF